MWVNVDDGLHDALHKSPTARRPDREWWWLAIGAMLSACVLLAVAHRDLVLGNPAGHWVYRYLYRFNVRALVVAAAVSALCGLVVAIPTAVTRRHEVLMIVMWLIVGSVAQYELRRLTPYSMERIFLSDGANGFYTVTRQYAGRTFLSNFDRIRSALPIHPRSNMPGKTLFLFALERLSMRPSVLVWLIVLVSNLGPVLMYLCSRELTGDPTVALYSLILSLVVPGRVFFFPVLNTITPVWVLLCLYLWLLVLRTGGAAFAALLGVAGFWLALYEPLPLVTLLLGATIAAGKVRSRSISVSNLTQLTMIAAAAAVACYWICRIFVRFDPFATFRTLLAEAARFNTLARRPYRIWVVENLFDFAVAAGLCQTVSLVALVGRSVIDLVRRRSRELMPATFCIGLVASVVMTDLSGINRGEVVRLWIFFACLAQLPAAILCARLGRAALMLVLVSTVFHTAVATSMMAFAQP